MNQNYQNKLIEMLKNAKNRRKELHFSDFYYHNTPTNCQVALSNNEKNMHNKWGFPYDHNLIQSIPHYINASPMHFGNHRYIAAQGPRKNTLNEFWKMVFLENVSVIVSVTNEKEIGTPLQSLKFHRFWPKAHSEMQYGDVFVTLQQDELIAEWRQVDERLRQRTFHVRHEKDIKTVYHLHMENWYDNGVVKPESLLELAKALDSIVGDGTTLVHCAAGVGRTGTFIAFHSLYHDILREQKNLENIDILDRIREMRRLRWGAIVAADHQFDLILQTLQLAAN